MTTLRPATGQTWTRPVDSVPIRTLEEVRRSVHSVRPSDVLALLGALAAATGVTALLFTQLLPWSGMFGFLVVAFVVFIAVYALLVSMDETGPVVRDRIASVLLHSVAALMLTALVFVIAYTLWRGRRAVTHVNFFTQDMADAGPLQSLSVGAIWHAILGT